MKKLLVMLLPFVLLGNIWAVDLVNLEAFKNIRDPQKRREIISQSPDDQKKVFEEIDHHLRLLDHFHDEDGIKRARKMIAVKTRGFGAFVSLIPLQLQIWDHYIGATFVKNEAAGMNAVETNAVAEKQEKQRSAIAKRQLRFQELVYVLAPSPAAIELSKKATDLVDKWQNWAMNSASRPPITEAERANLDKNVDEIEEELKTLPKLDPEQVQKEYDTSTEDKIWVQSGVD